MHKAIIENFIAAFVAANNKPVPNNIVYENGWFVFYTQEILPHVDGRYRKAKLLEMTERLKSRVE